MVSPGVLSASSSATHEEMMSPCAAYRGPVRHWPHPWTPGQPAGPHILEASKVTDLQGEMDDETGDLRRDDDDGDEDRGQEVEHDEPDA